MQSLCHQALGGGYIPLQPPLPKREKAVDDGKTYQFAYIFSGHQDLKDQRQKQDVEA